MTVGILTEKRSAARTMAAALSGQKGSFEGTDYVIAHARGHLYELAQPEAQIGNATGDEIAALKSWDLANLPWDLSRFDWKLTPIKGASAIIKDIRSAFAGVEEIVIATDVDPSGEGGSIAVNVLKQVGLDKKPISRMYFTDEAPASLQKAFKGRKQIPNLDQFDEYLMSRFRSAWDFASMQFTRVATASAAQKAVYRNGRLKSAIVLLVGDQRKAHDSYVKVTRFQNRFRDENGILYTDPDEATYAAEADVPQTFSASKVVLDSRQNKRTAPRALLDLAALSSRLSSKGITAAQVLATYQSMYEAQVVSYPRTEDKTITTEQFNELLPLVDKIAAVVGVDVSLLSHRQPRRTHVKDTGAHGANRPGPKVPSSLKDLTQKFGPAAKYIYEELARSYLAMLAEDYIYEAQEGHVADYPSFVGRCSVPKDQGWKAVFKDGDDNGSDGDQASGLGSNADPIVYEIVPPRPPQPTMKWLMKQLEKRDVGTGATRTSTYAEVTNSKAKNSLLAETRGKITLTEVGEVNYRLLPNTHIGDLSITEQVFSAMREIADGKTTMDAELAKVADLVRDDITTMKANAATMRKELGLSEQVQQKEKFTGTWKKTGQSVTFNREWGGHRFDDAECQRLLNDEEVAFSAVSARTGNPYDVYGKLGEGAFEGNKYIGFQKIGFGKKDASGNPLPPSKWGGRTFSQEEQDKLAAGEKVFADNFVSKRSGKNYETTVRFGEVGGEWKMIPAFSDDF